MEEHPMTDGSVVNNHGDRVRPPKPGVVGPNGRTNNGVYMGVIRTTY